MTRVTVPAELEMLEQVNAQIDALAAQENLSKTLLGRLRIVVEELFVNAAMHGSAEADDNQVEIEFEVTGSTVRLTFRDNGVPFNPLETEAPDIQLELAERSVGGLGLHLVHEICNELAYRFVDGNNELSATLKEGHS